MNYNKIEVLQKVAGKKKDFAAKIGWTVHGVNRMIKERSMTVETLEHICNTFNVPITFFFEDDNNELREPSAVYETKNNKDARIDLLMEMIREKDDEIARLNREIGRKDTQKKKGVA